MLSATELENNDLWEKAGTGSGEWRGDGLERRKSLDKATWHTLALATKDKMMKTLWQT